MKKTISFIKANVILIAILLIACIGMTYSIISHGDIVEMKNHSHKKIVLDTNKVQMADVVEILSMKQLKSSDLYKKNCRFCHGNEGKGDGVKARVDSTLCPYDLSKEKRPDKEVYYVILNGQNKMPEHGEKLNDESIKVLVVYIKRFKTN